MIKRFNIFRKVFIGGAPGMHYKCRNGPYPGTRGEIKRLEVPDLKVEWSVDWDDYKPGYHTLKQVLGKPWAEPEIGEGGFQAVLKTCSFQDCSSHLYQIVDKYPINPAGRTGLRGRGILGRWGANDAADPIATRWKRDDSGSKVFDASGKPILQFVGIKRKDCGEWAIPGGFIDPGEPLGNTLKREFMEETLNSLEKSEQENSDVEKKLDSIFSNGKTVYHGYVDDPRNTDNAWMSTTAVLFHDDTGVIFNSINLNAGDDAGDVTWIDMDHALELYASHKDFIEKAANLLNAHFR